jgi:hypothetical protein
VSIKKRANKNPVKKDIPTLFKLELLPLLRLTKKPPNIKQIRAKILLEFKSGEIPERNDPRKIINIGDTAPTEGIILETSNSLKALKRAKRAKR